LDAGAKPMNRVLRTATLTLEAKPSPLLITRLENRVDSANHDVIRMGVSHGSSATQLTSLLGVVMTSAHTWQKGKWPRGGLPMLPVALRSPP
jgi:hypothetical protein